MGRGFVKQGHVPEFGVNDNLGYAQGLQVAD
jgi:hypothetical protein